MAERFRGADTLVTCLQDAGVKYVFTLSGNQIMPVFDACVDTDIKLIHVRHEAAAVHMADAWGRLTGQPGVALVTAGPGMANCLSAMYVAQMAESPLVLISGRSPGHLDGKGAFQELSQAEMAAHVSKASWDVADRTQLADELRRALQLATAGRPGPIHLAIGVDTLDAQSELIENSEPQPASSGNSAIDQDTCHQLLDAISKARRPLMLGGPAMMRHHANRVGQEFGELANLPWVGMESPRGVNDPSLGAFAEVLAEADLLVLMGKRLDFTLQLQGQFVFQSDCRIVQVDADAAVLEQSHRTVGDAARFELAVHADPTTCLQQLAAFTGQFPRLDGNWTDAVTEATAYRPASWDQVVSSPGGPVHPVEVCRAVDEWIDNEQDVFVSDGGEFGQWAQACVRARRRLINGPSGSIGSAIPFALAARLAYPRHRVVAMLGDGTFGFHALELDTAVRYALPLVVVVGNDAAWNAEYQIQLRNYGARRAEGCMLLPTRYDEVARALGGCGERVASPAELTGALDRAAASELPACVNVALQRCAAPQIRRV